MANSKYPAVITAHASKAHLVRQVALDRGLSFKEEAVPETSDAIRFSFGELDESENIGLAQAMPKEVYLFHAISLSRD